MAAEPTTLLLAWRQGNDAALRELIPLVYGELHRIAHRIMGRQRTSQTIQTTALVNEAYLRLVDCQKVGWQDRAHFLAVASNLMRRILVDLARARNARRRGSGIRPLLLEEAGAVAPTSVDLVGLDDSLDALAEHDPRMSQVVELKFFGGLDTAEIAEVLHVSQQTVLRDWKLAKIWLFREMRPAQ